MSHRTLVITLGQLRAHQLTWANFRENVLDQLQADLAVCVPDDAFFDFTNPFYVNARYRWLIPDAPDFADIFDRIQTIMGSKEDWRVLCEVPGHWLGRILQSNHEMAGAVEYALRWFMLDNIKAGCLTEIYDRFIITRSDYYYLCPHPPLNCLRADSLWIPDGEDFGGLCNRHLVVSASNLFASCNLIDDLLLRPRQMREAMLINSIFWGTERVFSFHLTRNGLISKVKRFPYVMLLVRTPTDPTTTSIGAQFSGMEMIVKYGTELAEAERYKTLITSSEDWCRYFACQYFVNFLPARVYTSHRTVLYVDQESGELCHGPLSDSPENAYFVFEDAGGRIIHRSGDRSHHTFALSGRIKSSLPYGNPQTDGSSWAPIIFERVNIPAAGRALNNLVGFRVGNLYLSAEPDGRIILERSHCRQWEEFRLISDLRGEYYDCHLPRWLFSASH